MGNPFPGMSAGSLAIAVSGLLPTTVGAWANNSPKKLMPSARHLKSMIRSSHSSGNSGPQGPFERAVSLDFNKPSAMVHERVPIHEVNPESVYFEDYERYRFAAQFVANLAVLDVACG